MTIGELFCKHHLYAVVDFEDVSPCSKNHREAEICCTKRVGKTQFFRNYGCVLKYRSQYKDLFEIGGDKESIPENMEKRILSDCSDFDPLEKRDDVVKNSKAYYVLERERFRRKKEGLLEQISLQQREIQKLENQIINLRPRTEKGEYLCVSCDCYSMKFVERRSQGENSEGDVVYECEICREKGLNLDLNPLVKIIEVE